MNIPEDGACENTDRELWRERFGDFYADSVHITKDGRLGINCGGTAIVKPLKTWHDLASAPPAPAARLLHSFSSIDCEALIAAVLPGGSICDPQQVADSIRSYLNAWPPAPAAQASEPIDMVLHCPACGLQHVDAPEAGSGYDLSGPDDAETRWSNPEWTNPPHRSHLCHGCGHIWRPADVATNGVAAVKTKGKADSPPPQAQQGLQAPLSDPGAQEGEHG